MEPLDTLQKRASHNLISFHNLLISRSAFRVSAASKSATGLVRVSPPPTLVPNTNRLWLAASSSNCCSASASTWASYHSLRVSWRKPRSRTVSGA